MSKELEGLPSSNGLGPPAAQEQPERASRLTTFLASLTAEFSGYLQAILDPARSAQVLTGLHQYRPSAYNLYQGLPLERMIDVAPTLVHLEPGSEFMNWLLTEGFGQAWGVFLVSPLTLNELGPHLSHMTQIWDPDGRRMYFRFYDPRILPVFLSCSTAAELSHFCGAVNCFIVESNHPVGLNAYSWNQTTLIRVDLPLDSGLVSPKPTVWPLAAGPAEPLLAEDGRLILRPEQMDVFSRCVRVGFEDRLMDHLAEAYPEKTYGLDPVEFRQRVSQSLDRALAYGLASETDAAAYVGWNVELGQNFERQAEYAWVAAILNDPELEPQAKVKRIEAIRRGADILRPGPEWSGLVEDDLE